MTSAAIFISLRLSRRLDSCGANRKEKSTTYTQSETVGTTFVFVGDLPRRNLRSAGHDPAAT